MSTTGRKEVKLCPRCHKRRLICDGYKHVCSCTYVEGCGIHWTKDNWGIWLEDGA